MKTTFTKTRLVRGFFVIGLLLIAETANWALPLYTARSGRICDNCHTTPFKNRKQAEWKNPKLEDRKCNLSCQTCHVNPTGGGTRTVVGRYYAMSTLPMFGAHKRPYWDHKRNLVQSETEKKNQLAGMSEAELLKLRSTLSRLDGAGFTETQAAEKKAVLQPVVYYLPTMKGATKKKGGEFETFYDGDFLSYGKPFLVNRPSDQSVHAFDHDRYGPLNADPFVTFGFDTRLALVRDDETSFFPMQFDVGSAVHPFENVTVAGTVGLQGQRAEPDKRTLEDMTTLQNAFLMIHEMPYMSFVRGGIFRPAFGHGIEDHTAYVRQEFENSLASPAGKVLGGEIGMAPNYPYISLSGFTNDVPDGDFDGWGGGANFGWRDLAWGAGGSAIIKERSASAGDSLKIFSVNGYFNPGRWFKKYPLTIMGEFDMGIGNKLSQTGKTVDRVFTANFLELNYLLFNGMNVRGGHHFYDNDVDIKEDEVSRWVFGMDFTIVNGARWTNELRHEVPLADLETSWQFLSMLHIYL